MATIKSKPNVIDTPDLVSLEAQKLCETGVKHRARLRRYARAGGLERNLNVLVDQIDLDLCAAGWIARQDSNYASVAVLFKITRLGEIKLFEDTQANRERAAPHHELGAELAQWLRKEKQRMTWENVQFEFRKPDVFYLAGGVPVENFKASVLRPDVFSMVTTLDMERAAPQVHEVKVSRSDFLRDVADPSKREAYFLMAPQVFYAAEKGLILKSEVPAECGLLEHMPNGSWKTTKPAPKLKGWAGLDTRQWLSLVIKNHRLPETPH